MRNVEHDPNEYPGMMLIVANRGRSQEKLGVLKKSINLIVDLNFVAGKNDLSDKLIDPSPYISHPKDGQNHNW